MGEHTRQSPSPGAPPAGPSHRGGGGLVETVPSRRGSEAGQGNGHVTQRHPAADLALTETVRTLVVAWWSLAAYPSGHPALTGALENAHRQLTALLAREERLVIGVTRNGLAVGETRLRTLHAQKLARALYERQVAVVRFEHGIEPWELERLVSLLDADPSQDEASSLWDQLAAAGVSRVHLEPIDYSTVRMTDEVRPEAGEAESLWDRLVEALLAREQLSDEDFLWEAFLSALLAGEDRPPEERPTAPEETLSATETASLLAYLRRADAAGGAGKDPAAEPAAEAGRNGEGQPGGATLPRGDTRAGTGPGGPGAAAPGAARRQLIQLSATISTKLATAVESHLTAIRGAARLLAVRRTAELVRALPQEMRETVLRSALRALASDETAAEALQALSSPFAPDTILTALRDLESEGIKLSRHALRLAQTLAATSAEVVDGKGPGAAAPPDALLSELLVLFRDEDVDRYNPEDHQALFDRLSLELPDLGPLASGTPVDLGDRVDSLADDVLAEQLASTLLELLERWVEDPHALVSRLETLFRLFLTRGRLDQATEIVETIRRLAEDPQRPAEARSTLEETLGRMADVDALAALTTSLPQLTEQSLAPARRLVDRLGSIAVRSLLFVLMEEPQRSRRRRVFDVLASLGPAVVPEAIQCLSDPRWYVVRNMVVLLRTIGDRSSLPEIRRCAFHPDLRVRLEALKSLLAFDVAGARGLLRQAIHDPDPKIAEVAIALAGEHGTTEVADLLVEILTKWDPLGRRRPIRLKALWALGELAHPVALARLGRFFREWPVPLVSIEERRAAFESLRAYPEPARRPLVQKGLTSRDPVIREICRRLAGPA